MLHLLSRSLTAVFAGARFAWVGDPRKWFARHWEATLERTVLAKSDAALVALVMPAFIASIIGCKAPWWSDRGGTAPLTNRL